MIKSAIPAFSSRMSLISLGAKLAKLSPAQREARLHQLFSKDKPDGRAYLRERADRSAALQLKDPQGRGRVEMAVSADGNPLPQWFDDQGKVKAQFPKEAR